MAESVAYPSHRVWTSDRWVIHPEVKEYADANWLGVCNAFRSYAT